MVTMRKQRQLSQSDIGYLSPISQSDIGYLSPIRDFVFQSGLVTQERQIFQVSTFMCLHCAWNKRTQFKNIFVVVTFGTFELEKIIQAAKSSQNYKNELAHVAASKDCLTTEIHMLI
jgi:hypothetical protein